MTIRLDLLPGLVLAGLAFVVFLGVVKSGLNRRYPPGPKGWPIIGNLLDVPKSMSAKEYGALSKTYGECLQHLDHQCRPLSILLGDVVHLSVFGQHIVLLGSLEAAVELLDKRSSNYSDKPTSAMADL